MKVETLLGCQVSALIVCVIMIVIRLLVAYQKCWKPAVSEVWGCALFVFACGMCAACAVYWCVDVIKQILWVKQGLEPFEIRLKLMSVATWKGVYSTTLIAATCMWFGKFSFLLLYLPVYKQFAAKTKILYQVAAGFTMACFLVILFVFVFYCSPVKRNWIINQDWCSTAISKEPLNVALSLSIISDLLLFAIPVVLIIQLKKQRTRSEYTSLAFLIILAIGSIASTAYFAIDANQNNYNGGKPLTLDKRNIFIWNQVLANLLLLAAIAMPTVRVLVRGQVERGKTRRRRESMEEEGARLRLMGKRVDEEM